MDALRIGFVVISAPRLYAGIGLLLFVGVAELEALSRRRQARVGGAAAPTGASGERAADAPATTGPATADAGWAWNAAFAVMLGARLGFVLENLGYYRHEPLQALAFWRGGFSPWWGVAAGALVAGLGLRGRGGPSRLVLPAVVALGAWLVVPLLLSPAGGPPVAFPAGAFERLEGGTVELAEAAGAPTVVNLWASWCLPCRRELPQLARAAQEHPHVQVLYLNQGEGRETVEAFLRGFPAVRREDVLLDRRQQVGNALGSVGLPTTYYFDAAGGHVKTHVGEISGPALARELQQLGSASALSTGGR